MQVSVIIPAHNAADTAGETLRSLVAQTWPHWRAIVIDDGSTDATAAIVRAFIETEPRVRLIQQPKSGVSVARNNGIDAVATDWMCFLDADDLFLPDYLEKMTAALLADPALDAVTCGWARLLPDGSRFDFNNRPPGQDLFELLARDCVLAIHTVVMRTATCRRAGKFDTSLRTCEDWDLWARVARTGCKWGRLDDTLCLYRTRPGSASFDAARLIADSLVVTGRADGPDPRVVDPDPRYANGATAPMPLLKKWYHLCWFSAMALGRGQDAAHLVKLLAEHPAPDMDPAAVGNIIFGAMLLPAVTPPHRAYELWPKIEPVVTAFLRELERVNGVPDLTQRALRAIDREVVLKTETPRPTTVGRTALRTVDACRPIESYAFGSTVERARFRIELEGRRLADVTLPVVDGQVSADVIADAIADRCGWALQSAFFERGLYPTLRLVTDPTTGRAALYRDDLVLAKDLSPAEPFTAATHAAADWTLMLQELFARPQWPSERFYDPAAAESRRAADVVCDDNRFPIELTHEIPNVRTPLPALDVMPTVGGLSLGVVPVPVNGGVATAQQIRAAVVLATGLDLCRAIARVAFVGRPVVEPPAVTLRERLAGGWRAARQPGKSDLILARRAPVSFNTAAARSAVLPASAAGAMQALWEEENNPPVHAPPPGAARRVVYAPDLLQQRPGFVRPIFAPLLSRISSRLARTPGELVPSGVMLGFVPAAARGRRPSRVVRTVPAPSPRRPELKTERIPILMYHRVAPAGADMNRRWRVTPQEFEAQLAHLERCGYHSISFEAWRRSVDLNRPLSGRGVIITFDDGFVDFADHAWPLLKKFGFEATMFLVAGLVGRSNEWDHHRGGERIPLMDWNTIRQLQDEGVRFGGHTVSHPHLTGVSIDRCAAELAESRLILQRGLRQNVNVFAYPFGDYDEPVQHLTGACGYDFAVTCRSAYANHGHNMLALPRVEVDGTADLAAFAASVQWA